MNKKNGGIAAFLAVHVVCCGGLLLFATGTMTFGSILAWIGSGPVRLAGLAVLSVAAIALVVRLIRRSNTGADRRWRKAKSKNTT